MGDEILKRKMKVYSAIVEILSDILQVSFYSDVMCQYASITSDKLATPNLRYVESTFVSAVDGSCVLDAIPGLNCTRMSLADERFCAGVELESWEILLGVLFGNAFFLIYVNTGEARSANIILFPGEATIFPFLISGILLSIPTLLYESCQLATSNFLWDKCRYWLKDERVEMMQEINRSIQQSRLITVIIQIGHLVLLILFLPMILLSDLLKWFVRGCPWPRKWCGCLEWICAGCPCDADEATVDVDRGCLCECAERDRCNCCCPKVKANDGPFSPLLLSYSSVVFDVIRTFLILYTFGLSIVVAISLLLNVASFWIHFTVMEHRWIRKDACCYTMKDACCSPEEANMEAGGDNLQTENQQSEVQHYVQGLNQEGPPEDVRKGCKFLGGTLCCCDKGVFYVFAAIAVLLLQYAFGIYMACFMVYMDFVVSKSHLEASRVSYDTFSLPQFVTVWNSIRGHSENVGATHVEVPEI